MRYVNENLEDIDESEVDLSKGYIGQAILVKKDAKPIDNITKFAWTDEDFEEVPMYCLNPPMEYTPQDETDAMMVDHEYRLTLIELGL